MIPSVADADGTFSPDQVIAALRARNSQYAESTVRTHIVSRMCANTADHHGRVYDDLVRVDRGRYRLRSSAR